MKIRPIAEVYWTGDGGSNVLKCCYCGHEAIDESELWNHMIFGTDTTAEHREYATGKRQKLRLNAAQRANTRLADLRSNDAD